MKEQLKQLAVEQQGLKKARKTGTIPEFNCYTFHKLPESTRTKITEANGAAYQIYKNKQIITATHNFIHELRGSSYRHGHSSNDYYYKKQYEALKEQYEGQHPGPLL